MIRNNKGITLIALVVTIVVLLILAGITISGSKKGVGQSQDNTLLSDLNMVQHAVVERYNKYKITKDTSLLLGTKVSTSNVDVTGLSETIAWKVIDFEDVDNPEREYYRLNASNLQDLGLSSQSSDNVSYIVNYYTGEVYNETNKKTKDNQVLYLTSVTQQVSEMGDDIVKDGLLVWYDGDNNTGNGHSNATTTWKDLSGNGNDATLYGFDGTNPDESGWRSNYLAFDGEDDWANTIKALDYSDSKEMTLEFLDINGSLLQNDNIALPFESSSNWNQNDMGYGVSINEEGKVYRLRLTVYKKTIGYNMKRTLENIITAASPNKFAMVLNTSNEYNNFIKIYKNGEILTVTDSWIKDISNVTLNNYIMYIGARNGQEYFTKMNLANFKVYNRALSADEVKHNYLIDKAKYGIEE